MGCHSLVSRRLLPLRRRNLEWFLCFVALVRKAAMDFNHELQIIVLESHWLLQSMRDDDPRRRAVVAINQATKRAILRDEIRRDARVERPLPLGRMYWPTSWEYIQFLRLATIARMHSWAMRGANLQQRGRTRSWTSPMRWLAQRGKLHGRQPVPLPAWCGHASEEIPKNGRMIDITCGGKCGRLNRRSVGCLPCPRPVDS